MDKPELKNLLAHAYLAHQKRDLNRALALYQEFLAKMPEYPPALNGLAAILIEIGQYEKAENLLNSILKNDNDNITCLYNLARLHHIKKDYPRAKELYKKILKIKNDFAYGWNNLGLVYKELGSSLKAIDCLKKAAYIEQNSPFILNNLAVVLEEIDQLDEAEEILKKAVAIDENYFPARFNLGCLLFKKEKFNEAKFHLKWVLDKNPQDSTATFLLKSLKKGESPERAPLEYLEKTFDDWASNFENKLQKLEYKTHEILFKAIKPYLKHQSNILDLGCGTGLGAEYYRPYAQILCGIDCSSKMLQIARSKGIYDTLIKADILDKNWAENLQFDLIYSSDCLCYFGNLSKVFKRIKKLLSSEGVFGFSIEMLEKGEQSFQLNTTGRFSHKKSYVSTLLHNNGFNILKIEEIILRREKNSPVKGLIFIASLA